MSLTLSKRLGAVAAMVRGGCLVADVGTDHGYLPAFLVMQGKTDRAIGSDIGTGPLKNAEKTLRRYGLTDKVSLVLSDGLKEIPRDTGEIIIAGMGGTLIAEILAFAPWIRRQGMRLVLQPMSHAEEVRRRLCEDGFSIHSECSCRDEGRDYLVIGAEYSGEKELHDEMFYWFGDKLSLNRETDKRIIIKQATYINARRQGLAKGGKSGESEYFEKLWNACRESFGL